MINDLSYEKGVFNLARCMEIDGRRFLRPDGKDGRVIFTKRIDEVHKRHVVTLVLEGSEEVFGAFTVEGYGIRLDNGLQLLNLPPEKLTRTVTVWVNFYKPTIADTDLASVHYRLQDALFVSRERASYSKTIARIRKNIEIEYTEGEGLDDEGGE